MKTTINVVPVGPEPWNIINIRSSGRLWNDEER